MHVPGGDLLRTLQQGTRERCHHRIANTLPWHRILEAQVMGFELALYLKDPQRVDIIEHAIADVFARKQIAEGDDLLKRLEPHIEGDLRRPLVLLLLREGVLNRVKAAPSIDEYLLSLDPAKARAYFGTQRAAAAVVAEAGLGPDRRARDVELVATLPPKLALGKDLPGIGSLDAALRRLIVSASSEVWVVNPFFDHFGAASIRAPLIGRAKKGVKVRIVGRDLLPSNGGASRNMEPLQWLSHHFSESHVQDMLEIRDFTRRDEKPGKIPYALHSKILFV